MTPSTAEVARALVASLLRLHPGLRLPHARRAPLPSRGRDGARWLWLDGCWVLDLNDPATAGVLQEILVTTPGVVDMEVRFSVSTGWWHVWVQCDGVRFFKRAGPTLGGCVARTLLAVWGQP